MKAAERAEALSADISMANQIPPCLNRPRRTLAHQATPHLDLHLSDASSESAMLGSPVTDADQLASIDSDLFNVAQVENIGIE
jgi:hypothetical protein